MVVLRLLLMVLFLLWALLLLLVGGRFLLLLFDANRDSEIVDWVLSTSEFWIEPFFGIGGLSNEAVEGTGGAFEPASLIAFVVYLLVGGLVIGVVNSALFGWRWGGAGHTHVHE